MARGAASLILGRDVLIVSDLPALAMIVTWPPRSRGGLTEKGGGAIKSCEMEAFKMARSIGRISWPGALYI